MPTVYTVVRGDTLFSIAQRFYGDGMKFGIIAQANGISNPDRIFPGQVLRIPDIAPPPPPPPPPRHRHHRPRSLRRGPSSFGCCAPPIC